MFHRRPKPRGLLALGTLSILVALAGCGGGASIKNDSQAVAPATPVGLSAAAGDAQIALNWSTDTNATSYHVKRATTSGGPYTQVAGPTSISFTDTSVANGTAYYYVVSALDGAGESADSSEVFATPVAATSVPPTPTGLTATAGNAQVMLTWTTDTGATSYNVKRATTTGGPYSQLAASSSPSYTDTSVSNGTTYTYVVSALDSVGESADSSEVSATPVAATSVPSMPTGLTATAGNAQVVLNWTADSGATSYNVKRATTTGGPYSQLAASSSPSYTDTSVSNGTAYYYVVSALDSAGESANSTEVSAIPAQQAQPPVAPIGLGAVGGNAMVTLNWTSSSGATSYHVKRATASGGAYSQVGAPTSAAYTDTSVANGTKYFYVVSALDSAGESANSAEVSATPAAPTVPVLTSISVTPANIFVVPDGTQQFSAIALDQSSKALSPQPSITWTETAGSISGTGLYTSPTNAGTYTVTAKATGSTVTGHTSVTVATAGTCASIPASGDWDTASVSPVTPPAGEPSYEQNGKPMAIVVDPFVPSTVWLGTGSNGIFKSTNCGAPGSWVKIDTGANHAALDASDIWSMAVDPDPSRQGVIYALASYGDNGIWKSVNGGVDWTQLKIGSNSTLAAYFWSNMSMDASNTLHIAVTTHGTTSVSGYANGAIAESFDGGATWPNIVQMPAAWGEQGGVYLIPGTTSGSHSTWLWGTGDNFAGTYITQNSGASWPTTISDTAMGENNILPLQKASNGWYYLPAIKGLIKSQDGVTWSQAWNQNSNFQTPITDGFAVTGSTIYAGNSTSLYSAPLSNDSNWTTMPNPPALTSSDYIGFIAYDNAHGILYVSTWWSVFRYNVPSSAR